jgi:hypothetical protein
MKGAEPVRFCPFVLYKALRLAIVSKAESGRSQFSTQNFTFEIFIAGTAIGIKIKIVPINLAGGIARIPPCVTVIIGAGATVDVLDVDFIIKEVNTVCYTGFIRWINKLPNLLTVRDAVLTHILTGTGEQGIRLVDTDNLKDEGV